MLDRTWDPLRDFALAREALDRYTGRPLAGNAWTPALDVRERDDRFVVTLDLPGMEPSDVEVTFEDGTLTIRGSREFTEEEKDETYHRIERSFGSFARSVRLPRVADDEKIEASFDKGVLTVDVPKREEAKPRTIDVKAA